MKLNELNKTESQQLISNYVSYVKAGDDLNGTTFYPSAESIVIIQELDDEDEPDKYIITRSEVTVDEWNQMLDVIKRVSGQVDGDL